MAKQRDYYDEFDGSSYYGNVGPPRVPSPFGLGQDGGQLGSLLNAITPMFSEMARKQFGGVGFTFGNDINVNSAKFAREFLEQMQNARVSGAKQDSAGVEDLFRGIAVSIGQKQTGYNARGAATFGDPSSDIERAIKRLSSDATGLLPTLAAIFPDAVDSLTPGGSMAVASGRFVQAGRFQRDPLTGRSFAENADFAGNVLRPMIDGGPTQTAGLRAGQLGGIYQELTRRGMISNGQDLLKDVALRDKSDELRGVSDGLGPGLSKGQAQNVQANRVREKIKEYTESIAAINDIFTENGQKNASPQALFEALEKLTQGGVGRLSGDNLRGLARGLQGASQLSGLGLPELTALSGNIGNTLQQTGARRQLAGFITQYTAGAGKVFNEAGYGGQGPEGITNNQYLNLVGGMQGSYAGSDTGNIVGALVNLARYAPGTELAEVAAGLKAGGTGSKNFDVRGKTLADLSQLAERSGLGADSISNQLRASGANQAAFLRDPGLQKGAAAFQRGEFESYLGSALGEVLKDSGAKTEDILAALYKESQSAEVTDDYELSSRVGKKFNLNAATQAELGRLINEFGGYKGLPGGLSLIRAMSPDIEGENGAAAQTFTAQGEENRKFQAEGRGGLGQLSATTLQKIARGEFRNEDGSVNLRKALMSSFGFVSNPGSPDADGEAANALGAVAGPLGLIGGGGAAGPKSAGPAVGGNVQISGTVTIDEKGLQFLRNPGMMNPGGAVGGGK